MRLPLEDLLREVERDPRLTAEVRRMLPDYVGFTFSGYRRILVELKKTYSLVPFRDYRRTKGRRLILRHDVEGFLAPALGMAKAESRLGVRSTYFLLLSSRLYNPAEKTALEAIAEISRLGHEVGLHYDVNMYAALKRPPKETLEAELRYLRHLTGQDIRAMSRHNPSIQPIEDPFKGMTELMSAYDSEFTVGAHYVSDSCRAWYLEDLLYLLVRRPARAQLLIHPENWTRSKVGRYRALDACYADLNQENEADKSLWKKDWRNSERVPLYDKNLKTVRNLLG